MKLDFQPILNALFGLLGMILMSATSCLNTGCVIETRGGAEYGIGFRADNMLVVKHTVDGDKSNKTARTETTSQPFLDWLAKPKAVEADLVKAWEDLVKRIEALEAKVNAP